MSSHTFLPVLFVGVVTAFCSGCASPKPKPNKTVSTESRHKAVNPLATSEPDDGMKVSGILGSLDQEAIQSGLTTQLQEAAGCFDRQVGRQPYLSGSVTLEYRVARDGSVKRLRISESTLGSYEVESCIWKTMGQARFSKPRGGEAEFTYPLTFQGRLPVQMWDPGMVQEEITENREVLLGLKAEPTKKSNKKKKKQKRRRRRRRKKARPVEALVELVPPDGLSVTFYVDRKGRVVSAGLVAADSIEEDFATHFIANLKKITFEGAITQRYAKVIYRW